MDRRPGPDRARPPTGSSLIEQRGTHLLQKGVARKQAARFAGPEFTYLTKRCEGDQPLGFVPQINGFC